MYGGLLPSRGSKSPRMGHQALIILTPPRKAVLLQISPKNLESGGQ